MLAGRRWCGKPNLVGKYEEADGEFLATVGTDSFLLFMGVPELVVLVDYDTMSLLLGGGSDHGDYFKLCAIYIILG